MFILKIIFKIILKVILSLAVLAIIIFVIFNWPVKNKNENMKFGVSFSNIFARDIGLDWKKSYLAILDDLGVKRIRIGAYWTEIEKEKGKYDFSDLDWQIKEADKRGVSVVLAFGIKAPRWPECFIPKFYTDDKEKREKALLEYENNLIERYKGVDNIKIWQVENEPFLPFGSCIEGAIDANLLDKEIRQVKELDNSRQIMVTDSGELSIWYQAAKRADIFGTTLYRTIYKPPFGYVNYPIGPNFFKLKGWFIKIFAKQNNIMISELQAEPWGPKWLTDMSVDEQYKSMNAKKFGEIMDYAKSTGFSESYLWGAEWWYWLKEKKNDSSMWDVAKNLFSENKQ